MKTLRYLLKGTACSFDDCLDLCCKEKVERVKIEVDYDDNFLDFDLFRRLVVRTTWEFPSRTLVCISALGGYMLSGSRQRKQCATARANTRLRRQLARIRKQGIEIRKNGHIFFPSV